MDQPLLLMQIFNWLSKEKFPKWQSLSKGSCLNNQELKMAKEEAEGDQQPELEEEAEDIDHF